MDDDDIAAELIPIIKDPDTDQPTQAGRTRLQFYVAHRFSDTPAFEIVSLRVDGIAVRLPVPTPIPGNQGKLIELGFLEDGRTLDMAWEVHTEMANNIDGIIGVFHGSMHKRTILARLKLDDFKQYAGQGNVVVGKWD